MGRVIERVKATQYAGTYKYDGAAFTVSGRFSADGDKVVVSIIGDIVADGEKRADYEARLVSGNYKYDFSNVVEITELPAIEADVKDAVLAVCNELKAD